MGSIFSKIVSGDIPCWKVAETDNFLGFLDINPLAKGHTLAIPKTETDYLFDIDDELYSGLLLFSKKLAIAIKTYVECKRIGIAVVGFEVPHAHIHLVPINGIYDIDFSRPRVKLSNDEFRDMAKGISRYMEIGE